MSEFTQLETKTNNDIQWTCETCTFLNHVELQECEMCATVKPDTNANDTNANATADLNQAKQILSKLQPDIQTHILEEYVKPQVIADEISNMIKEFDELLMSDKCQRLEWRVLTEVVSKIINNKAALAQMCEKDTMGFKDSYEQHFIKGKNTFKHPSWTPLGSMCAELTMRQWH
jgi:Glu-tRNA(Gln) amidotransferase subunit E-like FAD-binding protein